MMKPWTLESDSFFSIFFSDNHKKSLRFSNSQEEQEVTTIFVM